MKNVNLLILIKQHFYYQIAAFGMIEENKQRPVNKPGPLLQSLEWGIEGVIINIFFQTIQVL